MPIRALRGFKRVSLAPGASTRIHFDLDPRDLSSVTQDGRRLVTRGTYRLTVGGGQPGTGAPTAAATFNVAGEYPLPL
jgi:beta-glucosidase